MSNGEIRKIGCVIPWYGDTITGGAEADLRDLAKHIVKRGYDLEILTTCVKDFNSKWDKNFHKPGISEEGGLKIRRFPAAKRDVQAFDNVNFKLVRGFKGIKEAEEDIYLKESVNSPELYTYIREHKDEYSVFIFTPYLFGTTYNGVKECFEKALLIPCFHDEPYAYFKRFADTYSKVRGIAFHARPEFELIDKIYDLSKVECRIIGDGMNTDLTFDAKRFRDKYKIDSPFILYAGRKDAGKNIYTLIDYFREFKNRNTDGAEKDLKLILIGGGTVDIPEDCRDTILDMGFLPVQDKYDAYAASAFTCQPSKNESFSLVIMESWLCQRPVLVCEDCAVTTNFVKESNGGLYFKDYYDFEAATKFLLNDKRVSEMAANGCRFVKEHFSWDNITDQYISFIRDIEQK